MQAPATPSSLLFGRPPHVEPIGFSCPPPETPSLFFGLSAELRNRIYRYALYRAPPNLPIAYEPLPALLDTCRQIRSEATALYFFLNIFTVELRMSEAEHCLNLLSQWIRIRTAQNQLSLILGLKIYILLDGSAPKCDPRFGDVLDGEWPMSKEGKEMIFGSRLRNVLKPVVWSGGRDLVSVMDVVVHGTGVRQMEVIPPEDRGIFAANWDRWWRTRLAWCVLINTSWKWDARAIERVWRRGRGHPLIHHGEEVVTGYVNQTMRLWRRDGVLLQVGGVDRFLMRDGVLCAGRFRHS